MKKLAIFSPLPPLKTGISYYSQILAKELAKNYDITFFVDNNYDVSPEISEAYLIVRVNNTEETVKKLSSYHAVLYHFGNNHYHMYMYDIAVKYSGIVVLHDYVLHHLVGWVTQWNQKEDFYLDKIRKWTPEFLKQAKLLCNTLSPEIFECPLNDEIVASSKTVIVHSVFAQRQLQSKFSKKVVQIPLFHIQLSAIKHINDDKKDNIHITCFGFITQSKRIHIVLSVFEKLAKEHKNIHLNLVGELSHEMNDIKQYIQENNLKDKVIITGFCSDDEFENYLSNTDICINLRYPTAGETSATLVQALGYGIPTIVSQYQQYNDYPDDVVCKVPLDNNEKKYLYTYLNLLIQNKELRRSIGENAKEYIQETSTLLQAIMRYRGVIESVEEKYKEHNKKEL